MSADKPTSFRLSPEAMELLAEIARRLGVSKTAVLEILIRQAAKESNITRNTP